MAGIIDQFGNPIPRGEIWRLRQAVATPAVHLARSPWSFDPADGMLPAKLARIHAMAARGYSREYFELAENIEERDLHYAGVLGTRKRSLTQLPVTVIAASDEPAHVEHQQFVEDWIATGCLEMALFDLLDAVGKGLSIMEIEWETHPGRIRPARLVYRPARWFEVSQQDGETVMLREGASLVPLAPHKFLVHRHPGKSGLPIRNGLARVASWAWMYKAFTAKDWAIFVQNYGQPMRVGRYGPEATAADREVLFSAVANIAGDCAAIIPKSMEIEFVEVGDLKAGSELYERRCDWLDRQVSKLVLGQTTTTDAVSGGHAVSREHRLVQEDIERSDAMMVSATITRQLVHAMIAFTFGPQEKYPHLRIGRPDEVPLAELVEAVAKLGPLGLTVAASDVRDRLGLSEPEADAPVIGGRPAAPLTGAAPVSGGTAPPRPSLAAPPRLMSLHAQEAPAALEALLSRVSEDAQGALSGLVEEVRTALMAAEDLPDLARRISALRLAPEQLAEVLGRGLALANLVGQQQVLEDIRAQGGGGAEPSAR